MISIWLRPVKPANGLFALRGALYYYRQKLAQGVPDAVVKFEAAPQDSPYALVA